ncbi:hypothetical protein D3C83_220130 [compost metagenome]
MSVLAGLSKKKTKLLSTESLAVLSSCAVTSAARIFSTSARAANIASAVLADLVLPTMRNVPG